MVDKIEKREQLLSEVEESNSTHLKSEGKRQVIDLTALNRHAQSDDEPLTLDELREMDELLEMDGAGMKHEPKSHINERLHTGLAQSGRAAGMGISYDRYDDESGNPDYNPHDTCVRLPHDSMTKSEIAALSGDVRVTKGEHNGKQRTDTDVAL